MKLVMSCYKCGNKEFEYTSLHCYEIEGHSYLSNDYGNDDQVICKKCGLKDYIKNLVVTFEV